MIDKCLDFSEALYLATVAIFLPFFSLFFPERWPFLFAGGVSSFCLGRSPTLHFFNPLWVNGYDYWEFFPELNLV